MKVAVVAALAFLVGTPALAADMAVKAAAPPAAPTWTGAYLGLGFGGRWIDNDWRTTATFFPNGAPMPFQTDPTASFNSVAPRAGIYLGYDWQIASAWVVGVEGDIGFAHNDSTLASRIPGLGFAGIINNGSSVEVQATWDASGRVRAGFLITPAVLLYGTGGFAVQHIRETTDCAADTNVCDPAAGIQTFTQTWNRWGWTAGGGLEAALGQNFFARVEYRYADYGSVSFVAIPPTLTTFGANANLATKIQIATAGISYKFK